MEDFVHLNVHTHYSTFSGVSGIQELVDKAISCDMRGMAITDDVNICGIKEFDDYVRRINKQRKNEGLEQFKPIFGCDLFVRNRRLIISIHLAVTSLFWRRIFKAIET